MKLNIIIPAYNEAENISFIVSEIEKSIACISDELISYEIIIVDDSSTDETFAESASLSNPFLSVIRLSRRSGSHIAIRAGLDAADGDVVICVAADGQDDPHTIPKMIIEWKTGKDIVWALRNSRKNESFLYKCMTRIFYRLLVWFGETNNEIDLSRADFYLLDRKVVDAITACKETNTSLFGIIAWIGFKQGYIEYERRQRHSGQSKWNLRSKIRLAKDWIIAFSGIPLKLLTIIGFSVACVGFIYAFTVVIRSLIFGSPVQGWSSVMTAILVLGGGQMMMLGILGEYLWRTLDESRNRPGYFVEKSKMISKDTP